MSRAQSVGTPLPVSLLIAGVIAIVVGAEIKQQLTRHATAGADLCGCGFGFGTADLAMVGTVTIAVIAGAVLLHRHQTNSKPNP